MSVYVEPTGRRIAVCDRCGNRAEYLSGIPLGWTVTTHWTHDEQVGTHCICPTCRRESP
ncbi:MAG: hypothetical protein Q4Q62_05300 [Thermoplasmata archaeon]|nr:hypothetical protein [Thermoplasmata archaeon]